MGAMTVAELQVLVNARIDKLERALDEAEKRTDRFAKRAKTDVERASAAIDKSFEGLIKGSQRLGVALTAGVTLPLAALAKKSFDAAVGFDSLKRGLSSVAGSAAETEKQLARLREVAKAPGLGFREAIQGSIALQAAGLSAQNAERSLKAFGNALATVGKGKADLDGVTLALTQMSTKGRVMGQELNQLAERVPQIRKAMLEAFGTADTEKLQRAGVSFEEFLSRVLPVIERLPQMTSGIQNELETAADDIDVALSQIGEAMTPVVSQLLKDVVPAIKDLAQQFHDLSPEAKSAWLKLGAGLAVLGPLSLAFSGVMRAVAGLLKMRVGIAAFFAATETGATGATAALGRMRIAAVGLGKALGVVAALWGVFEIGSIIKNAQDRKQAMADWRAKGGAFTKESFADAVKRAGALGRSVDLSKLGKSGELPAFDLAGRSGGGGGGKGQSEAAQATERLRGVIADLNREVALGGDKSKLAALKWELLNGEYAKASPVVKAAALALQAQAEAMERAREAQDSYRETLREVYKQTQLGSAATEVERANIERLAKGLPALTEAQQAQLGAAIDRRDAEKEYREALERSKHSMGPYAQLGLAIAANYRDQTNALRQTTAAIEREIDLLKTKGDVEAALYELEGRHGRFKGASKEAGAAFLDATKQLAAMGFVKQWVANLKAAAEAGAEARKQAALAADGRFAEYMGDLAKRVKLLGANSREAALALELMAKGFAVDPKSAEGIARLQEAIKATLEVERIERFRAELDKLKNSLEQGFMSMFDRILGGGFRNLFSNILQGFRQLLSDIAREFLASQIRGLLTRALGGLFGGGGGGSALASGGGSVGFGVGNALSMIAGRAVGGPVMRGEPYLVGEHGPELMVPNQSGRVLTARETSRVKGGQQVVNVTINATDAPSFARSRDMVAAEIGHAIARANRRGGR